MKEVVRIAYSPDGSRAAVLTEEGALQVWSPDFKQRIGRPVRLGNGYPIDLDWRSDGKRIAVAGEHGVVIADPDKASRYRSCPPTRNRRAWVRRSVRMVKSSQ